MIASYLYQSIFSLLSLPDSYFPFYFCNYIIYCSMLFINISHFTYKQKKKPGPPTIPTQNKKPENHRSHAAFRNSISRG